MFQHSVGTNIPSYVDLFIILHQSQYHLCTYVFIKSMEMTFKTTQNKNLQLITVQDPVCGPLGIEMADQALIRVLFLDEGPCSKS